MKQVHEYAKFFPPMEGEEFKALCQDVKDHGLLNPIVLYEDQILDGRNRALACDKVGVRPKYEDFKNGNALDYVVSQNVLRRHLTQSQRAILALELEEKFAAEPKAKGGATVGGRTGSGSGPGFREREKARLSRQSATRAAKALRVGRTTVAAAKRLATKAPQYIPEVRAGRMTVTEAYSRADFEKVKAKAKAKRHQETNRQVAEYTGAMNAYRTALKVVQDDIERFAPEAVQYVLGRHTEIRSLMTELEAMLKKKKAA